jgi:protocatechuate 3,4-dioxygenase alpha subunit
MEPTRPTPSQTIGPFFAYSLTAEQYGYNYDSILSDSLLGDRTEGEPIYITGTVVDGKGNSISDAMIELWQADAQGNYRIQPILRKNNGFIGFGRLGTGSQAGHSFEFETLKPGPIEGQAPHINVILFMRGSLHHLYTRIYFSDEKTNENDKLLNAIDPMRRQTLIAQRKVVNKKIEYHFDIHMQGKKETVFFDVQK